MLDFIFFNLNFDSWSCFYTILRKKTCLYTAFIYLLAVILNLHWEKQKALKHSGATLN